jgi:hypothetical protein
VMPDHFPDNLLGFELECIRSVEPLASRPGGLSVLAPSAKPDDPPQAAKSQATEIVEMALEKFRLQVNPDGEAFVVTERVPHLASQIRGGKLSLRQLLAAEYFDRHDRAPSGSAIADALSVLEGKAQRLAPTQTHLRVAHHAGAIYIDIGGADGLVARIDKTGWTIEPTAPVIFRRTEIGQAMPIPDRNGNLDALWSLCNIPPDERPLVLAWLLATFMPDTACPILALVGEQGCAKSTSARVLASLVDPSMPQLRRPPTTDVDWPMVAHASRVVALDNMSHVPDRLSDGLCRAVTGDGDVRRRLYSDGNVVPFAFKKAILLNGISLGLLRGDLAERTLSCSLSTIPPEQRKLDAEINADLEQFGPQLLGALFNLMVRVLGEMPNVKLPGKPRMSDFAVVVAAVDRVLGTNGLDTYLTQLHNRVVDTIDGNSVLMAIKNEIEDEWNGTAAELMRMIEIHEPEGHDRRSWPNTSQKVTAFLTRHGPAMRESGWMIRQEYDSHRKVNRWFLSAPIEDCNEQTDPSRWNVE